MDNRKEKESMNEKEKEIIESYEDETEEPITEVEIEEEIEEPISEVELEEIEEPITEIEIEEDTEEIKENHSNKKFKRLNLIMNIIFTVLVVILLLSIVDIYLVAKHNIGPFLAIPTNTYKDGGTKEYYGFGYKVIKYHQLQGRRDMEVGTWKLKYDDKAITIQDIDLAIALTDNASDTYDNYYKEFVRIISTLKSVDTKKHTITLGYADEDGKYSLDIICKMNKDQDNLKDLEKDKETTIIGTLTKFKEKTAKKNNRIYISDCFAEQ